MLEIKEIWAQNLELSLFSLFLFYSVFRFIESMRSERSENEITVSVVVVVSRTGFALPKPSVLSLTQKPLMAPIEPTVIGRDDRTWREILFGSAQWMSSPNGSDAETGIQSN